MIFPSSYKVDSGKVINLFHYMVIQTEAILIFLELQYVMITELAEIDKLQNSVLDSVLEIKQTGSNATKVFEIWSHSQTKTPDN